MDGAIRSSDGWNVETKYPGNLDRDFDVYIVFPKSKVNKSGIRRIRVRARPHRNGTFIAEGLGLHLRRNTKILHNIQHKRCILCCLVCINLRDAKTGISGHSFRV